MKKTYTALYKDQQIPYEIYTRPLIHWCRDLLMDPFLFPKFQWTAERHFRVSSNGSAPERVIGEPWTANTWWKIQVGGYQLTRQASILSAHFQITGSPSSRRSSFLYCSLRR